MSGPESVEGLITRLGRWLDRRFQAKATQEELRYFWNQLENASIKDKVEMMKKLEEVKTQAGGVWTDCIALVAADRKAREGDVFGLRKAITDLTVVVQAPSEVAKELSDLKTRMEKMELYAGMTRKVDPTKPPIVKSAFQM